MKAIIRSFSVPTEFCLVLFLCFGLTIVDNTAWVIQHLRIPSGSSFEVEPRHLQNDGIIFLAVFEVATLAVVLGIGRIRGWSVAQFGLAPSLKWTAVGVILFFAFGLVGRALRRIAAAAFHSAVDFHRVNELTIPVVALICVINPVFEETLECGYFFHALHRHGMWVTVLASAVFRGFLHSTMGFDGFVFMFAEGLLHGFFYWRWRQLWPLIVAHGLQMLYALLPPALA